MTGTWSRVRRYAAGVDAATPPQRDRTVDALRAVAIAGVVGGHWLVTALVPGSDGGAPALRDTSPLASMPALAPLSWVFQTLALFFLVGGYSAARGYRGGYRAWLRQRLARLARPVAVLAAVWTPVTAALCLAGCPLGVTRTLLTLVLSPLWFLGVYAVLTALTPAAIWLARRFGAWAAALPVAVVAAADLVRFGLHGPGWVGWVNLPAGWLVPYLLGVAWALGALRGRKGPALMAAAGGVATLALIALAGYPASMVGVNGAAISNLNPPTIAAVAFGVTQCGLALLARGPLARWTRRPVAWAAVAGVNLSAMTLFLWHQTAFIMVTSAGMLAGLLPGLLTTPAGPAWIAERLAWMPVFAIALTALWLIFRVLERPARRTAAPAPAPAAPPAPAPAAAAPAPVAAAPAAPAAPAPAATAPAPVPAAPPAPTAPVLLLLPLPARLAGFPSANQSGRATPGRQAAAAKGPDAEIGTRPRDSSRAPITARQSHKYRAPLILGKVFYLGRLFTVIAVKSLPHPKSLPDNYPRLAPRHSASGTTALRKRPAGTSHATAERGSRAPVRRVPLGLDCILDSVAVLIGAPGPPQPPGRDAPA